MQSRSASSPITDAVIGGKVRSTRSLHDNVRLGGQKLVQVRDDAHAAPHSLLRRLDLARPDERGSKFELAVDAFPSVDNCRADGPKSN
jgi:hypothetical protein